MVGKRWLQQRLFARSQGEHASQRSTSRCLAFENLENRTLLAAGNVFEGAVDLGELDFYRDEHVNLVAGEVAYQFNTAHDAELTIDATDTDGDCTISLYDSNFQLLERREGTAEYSASSRVDYSATAGERYYVSVSGNDADLEIRFGNQMGRGSGGPMPIYGSAADDLFEVVGSTVTINDIKYMFFVPAVIGAAPVRFAIDGAEGNDTVVLRGYGNAELDVWPDSVTWKTEANEVEATDISYVHGYGHNDGDVAHLHGSAGADKLKIEPDSDSVKLIGSGYLSRVKFFGQVVVEAGDGEDVARIWDTETNDLFYFNPERFQFVGHPDWNVRGYGFEDTMIVCSAGGTDWAALVDSDGDDLFYALPHKAQWSGPEFNLTLRGMSFIEATSSNGGNDRAKLHGSTGNDQFETLGKQAGLSTWNGDFVPLYRIGGFEWVKAYSHGGEDVSSLDPEADFETVLDGDWTEVPRDELAEHLLSDGGGFF